jgi:hypothetical protein
MMLKSETTRMRITTLTITWAKSVRDPVQISVSPVGGGTVFIDYSCEPYGLVLQTRQTKYVHPWHTIELIELK